MRKLLLLPVLLLSLAVSAFSTTLDVYFIDVGQGDAILVDYGSHELLIDGGSDGTCIDTITQYVDGYLDIVVATHPHSDHIGGLDDVIRAFDVLKVIDSGATASSQAYESYASAVAAERCRFEHLGRNDSFELDDLTFEVIHPHALVGDANEDSLVLLLTYGDVDFLFTGDIGKEAEDELLQMQCLSDIDILKVAHHGSRYSTTAAFLDVVQPELAIYSAGVGNRYGHPHSEALDRLEAAGAAILGTDKYGMIRVSTDGSSWSATDTSDAVLAIDGESNVSQCEICLSRLNDATYDDFLKIEMVSGGRATNLVEAQPFTCASCDGAASIEAMLDDVKLIGTVLRERIARHFCPELYRD